MHEDLRERGSIPEMQMCIQRQYSQLLHTCTAKQYIGCGKNWLSNSAIKLANLFTDIVVIARSMDWIVQSFTSRQHSIGYMGDGFYRSKDPTNSIKVLKEKAVKVNNPKNTTKKHICIHTQKVDKYSVQL